MLQRQPLDAGNVISWDGHYAAKAGVPKKVEQVNSNFRSGVIWDKSRVIVSLEINNIVLPAIYL